MNGINSVRITVNGVNYTINTVEPEEYVQKLADELNGAVSEIRDKNSSWSGTAPRFPEIRPVL